MKKVIFFVSALILLGISSARAEELSQCDLIKAHYTVIATDLFETGKPILRHGGREFTIDVSGFEKSQIDEIRQRIVKYGLVVKG